MQALADRLAVVNFGTLKNQLENAKVDGHSLTEVKVEKVLKSLAKVKV